VHLFGAAQVRLLPTSCNGDEVQGTHIGKAYFQVIRESSAIRPLGPPGLIFVILRAATRPPEAKCTLMAGHECYHCKQWVGEGEPHDCWSTTEAALTRHLSDDLREAWERRLLSASSESTPRTTRSCSRGKPATFSCVRNKNTSNCVSSSDGGSKLPRCDG
jgi:hypothetical protein